MKKLINHVDTVLAESLDGFTAAHADIVALGKDREFVRRRHMKPGKVALISLYFSSKTFEKESEGRTVPKTSA